jgi:SAM-dependent methyltransferase
MSIPQPLTPSPDATLTDDGAYVGGELELFRHAVNWKAYMRRKLAPFITGRVIEVGAGIGGTTENLADLPGVTRWTCVEPDAAQCDAVAALQAAGTIPAHCTIHRGYLSDLPQAGADTVIYIDVLEHIEDDRGELALAAGHLKPGGRVVVLAPAYQSLFGPFDKAVGHYRRYTLPQLRALADSAVLREEAAFHLDAVGLAASLANKLVLGQSLPTKTQVALWDKAMVPVSRLLDPLVLNRFGKSAIMVWQRK